MADKASDAENFFGKKLYDVENCLSMYAYSQYLMPAKHIYDDAVIKAIGQDLINKCHIYMVGTMPALGINEINQGEGCLVVNMRAGENSYDIEIPMPQNFKVCKNDGIVFLEDENGDRYTPKESIMLEALNIKCGGIFFDVLYIGQAYGDDGSRNALDRLRKHETLQKISLTEKHENKELHVLMLEVEPNNKIITLFNPHALNNEDGEERIKKGLDKLFNTDGKERITLYEASMIRYFQPKFNKEFKNSFPSTNLKVLNDCYDKDFAGVVAEFCFDEMFFRLRSEVVEAKENHIAQYDLHKEEDRKFFFSKEI